MKKSHIIGLILACALAITGGYALYQQNQAERFRLAQPQLSELKNISELAVLECYYHNVARFHEENATGALFWKKDKHFWVEYDGIVRVGVDASLITMSVSGDKVTITLPPAQLLSSTVVQTSFHPDSFILAKGSAKIEPEDSVLAFAEAQDNMRLAASQDTALLNTAHDRVKLLLTNYVENLGSALGISYQIQWENLET